MNSRGTAIVVALLGFFILPLSYAALFAMASQATRALNQAKPAIQNPKGAKNNSPVARSDTPYYFDVWTTDNGLPQNSVAAILQGRDGFLWFTTTDGLVRYDGVRFTVFNAGNRSDLKTSRLSQLFEDRDGILWIVAEDGTLISYKDGHFRTYTTEDGLPHNRIATMRADDESNVLVETFEGIAVWKGERFVTQGEAGKRQYSGFDAHRESGIVWYYKPNGLYRVDHGRRTTEITIEGVSSFADIKHLYEDREGTLWVGITNGILVRYKNGKLTYYTKKDGLPGTRINAIRADNKGNLWIGLTEAGLFRFKDEHFTHYSIANELANRSVLTVYEDREKNVWVGMEGGLVRVRDNIITAYSVADGLSADNTYPICRDREGNIWIGAWKGLTRYKDGVFTQCAREYGVWDHLLTALATDSDGALWMGSLGGGVTRYKDGKSVNYTVKDGLPINAVRAILQDRQGFMWFGTLEGLARYKDGNFAVYTVKEGLVDNNVNVIFEDSKGDLWFGTRKGLCRYSNGQFHTYPQEESVSSHLIRTIYEDKEGVMWIGTYDSGLTRLKDGKFTNYSAKEGLFNNGVFQILEDARENFWISCNLGIYRVSKKELNDYAEGLSKTITSIPYGKRDGMLNSECNGGTQPAGIRNLDGKLWFPTQGGVVVVDPEAVPVSTQPPPLRIEEFLLNNEPVEFRETVEVPPGIENFEIHYTGLSFIMSDRIRFKYKLEGLNTDWVDAGTRRVAYYSHIPPGDYTFRVIAANRDGVWNMEGVTVAIRIIPPFWKTWWFISIVLAGLAGVVWVGFKFRIQQLEKARRAQETFSQQLISSQENERQRIAAELHDGLGQHLLIIKNSALLGLGALGQQELGKEQLNDISATASQAIDEVREISYNLRPYQLDDLGLTKAIEFIIAKVAGSSEIQFDSELDRIDDLFSPEAEINIYRIVQESLNNIVKHSRASRAKIIITRTSHQTDIMIQDNGRGFNTEKIVGHENGSGFGLKGISERARMLGAKYVVQSVNGQGTIVSLSLETPDG
jgi:ligand-binding sensor domain-containing protein/signal transduction histidine kinase